MELRPNKTDAIGGSFEPRFVMDPKSRTQKWPFLKVGKGIPPVPSQFYPTRSQAWPDLDSPPQRWQQPDMLFKPKGCDPVNSRRTIEVPWLPPANTVRSGAAVRRREHGTSITDGCQRVIGWRSLQTLSQRGQRQPWPPRDQVGRARRGSESATRKL